MTVMAMHRTKGFLQNDGTYKPSKDDLKAFPEDLANTVSKDNGLTHYVHVNAFVALKADDLSERLIAMIVAETDVARVTQMLCTATGHHFEHYCDHIWNCGDALVTRDNLADMLREELPGCKLDLSRAYAEATGLDAWVMAGGYILHQTGVAA